MNKGNENNHERERDGAKSVVKAAWNKWKSRTASNAMQTAVKALVATGLAGGLAVTGVAVNGQLSSNKSSIAALQAQNTQVAKDLPTIHSDVDAAQEQASEAQKQAEEAKATAGSSASQANTASEQSKVASEQSQENAKKLDEVAANIQGDSKENSDAISAVKKDLETGKISSADAIQKASTAIDQASANQTALVAEATRVDGIVEQVTQTAQDAKSVADGAVTQAKDALAQASAASTDAAEAKRIAQDALTKANEAKESAAQAVSQAQSAQNTADEANQYAHFAADTSIAANQAATDALSRAPIIRSITETENLNGEISGYYGANYQLQSFSFDGGQYLFSYTWIVSGSCMGGIRVADSATDIQNKPYPTIRDGYTSRSAVVTPPANGIVSFVVDELGECSFSDIIITITRVGS